MKQHRAESSHRISFISRGIEAAFIMLVCEVMMREIVRQNVCVHVKGNPISS